MTPSTLIWLLIFFLSLSAACNAMCIIVINHIQMTRRIAEYEAARLRVVVEHLETQVAYFKEAEKISMEESERYFQMARELQYQVFTLQGGKNADHQ